MNNKYNQHQLNNIKLKEEKKSCPFCTNQNIHIDYKNAELLNQYISGQAKIKKRRRTGVCAMHQRKLAKAIKRARNLAILPASSIHNFFNIEEKRAEKQRTEEKRKESIKEEEQSK